MTKAQVWIETFQAAAMQCEAEEVRKYEALFASPEDAVAFAELVNEEIGEVSRHGFSPCGTMHRWAQLSPWFAIGLS